MGIIRELLKDFELTSAQVADAYEGALEDVKETNRGEERGGDGRH